jgi:glycosyltransferase involved in cell wall biosynthesis
MNALELAIVMPVFNEEASLTKVVEEWLPHLQALQTSFKFYILDDGSRDQTPRLLRDLQKKYASVIETFSHANRGHGQTCIAGYRIAIGAGARWILQIDSDGQCDPRYLKAFWQERSQHPLVFGYRQKRDDGFLRFLISRVVAFVCWMGLGVWVKDPNVPYRLMTAGKVEAVISKIPPDFYLANILLSLLLQQQTKIYWIALRFRDRFGGSPSVKFRSFAQHGKKLFLHLLRIRSKI